MAARPGAIGTLIAETGGLNVMLADSSALAEQLVLDVVQSGFNSAGQRCSALRVLLVQEEIAPRVQTLLAGCMDELVLGDPARLETDVGPVIDDDALSMLEKHAAQIVKGARWSHRAPQPRECAAAASSRRWPSRSIRWQSCKREVFGPVVHVLALSRARSRRGGRRGERAGLRPHARHPHAHRRARAAHRARRCASAMSTSTAT